MNIQNKYLKYKNKYLTLKKKYYDQNGGVIEKTNIINIASCGETCRLCYATNNDEGDNNDLYNADNKFILNCGCCIHISCFFIYRIVFCIKNRASLADTGLYCMFKDSGCQNPNIVTTPDDLKQMIETYPELIDKYTITTEGQRNLHDDITQLEYLLQDIINSKIPIDPIVQEAIRQESDPYSVGITKQCPTCSNPTTHFQGHACHAIKCLCHIEWCYICKATIIENREQRGMDFRCRCTYRNPENDFGIPWSHSFCPTKTITEALIGYDRIMPYDTRCGCFFCNECKFGKPCDKCEPHGECLVCKGIVKPGPTEAYRPEMGKWLITNFCTFENLNNDQILEEIGRLIQPKIIQIIIINCVFNRQTNYDQLFSGFINLKLLHISNSSSINIKSLLSSLPNKNKLKNLSLTNIPIPTNTIDIELLTGLTNLNTLSINFCNITSIQRGSFKDLINLSNLDLDNNNLANISKTIHNCTQLLNIQLQNNKITTINNNNFPNNVKIINLKNNKIENIEVDAFNNLTQLIQLDLQQNKINILNNFSTLHSLKKINLDNNQILNIDLNIFPMNISEIILSNNFIKTILSDTFANLGLVRKINLNNNKIERIRERAFSNCISLKKIYLKNNAKLTSIIANMFNNLPTLQNIIINNPETFNGIVLPNNATFINN